MVSGSGGDAAAAPPTSAPRDWAAIARRMLTRFIYIVDQVMPERGWTSPHERHYLADLGPVEEESPTTTTTSTSSGSTPRPAGRVRASSSGSGAALRDRLGASASDSGASSASAPPPSAP